MSDANLGDFPLDEFLARPLVCRLATAGPFVRPVWYLWEDGAFWILTGSWSSLPRHIESDPSVSLVIDLCDLETGETLLVTASGRAEILPFDVPRGRRMLARYLGGDEARWDRRFTGYLDDDPGTVWARVTPTKLRTQDLSFQPSGERGDRDIR